ncbi:MAG: hypothetical protein ACKOYN_12210 [Planctomycetota bacterium]
MKVHPAQLPFALGVGALTFAIGFAGAVFLLRKPKSDSGERPAPWADTRTDLASGADRGRAADLADDPSTPWVVDDEAPALREDAVGDGGAALPARESVDDRAMERMSAQALQPPSQAEPEPEPDSVPTDHQAPASFDARQPARPAAPAAPAVNPPAHSVDANLKFLDDLTAYFKKQSDSLERFRPGADRVASPDMLDAIQDEIVNGIAAACMHHATLMRDLSDRAASAPQNTAIEGGGFMMSMLDAYKCDGPHAPVSARCDGRLLEGWQEALEALQDCRIGLDRAVDAYARDRSQRGGRDAARIRSKVARETRDELASLEFAPRDKTLGVLKLRDFFTTSAITLELQRVRRAIEERSSVRRP